jgi:hypothetical protein
MIMIIAIHSHYGKNNAAIQALGPPLYEATSRGKWRFYPIGKRKKVVVVQ